MYYKLGQVLQIRAIITNWGITVTTFFFARFISLHPIKPLFERMNFLMNFQELLLVFIFKCFFKDFVRNGTHASLFLICRYIFSGRIFDPFHFSICFLYGQFFVIRWLRRESGCLLTFSSLTEQIYL